MRRQRKIRRSGTLGFGTLQNPEAHKNGMSWEEAQALRKREIERDHEEAQKILTDIVVDLAREKGIPIPWEQQPAPPADAAAAPQKNSEAPPEPGASAVPAISEASATVASVESARVPRPARRRRLLGERVAKRPDRVASPEPDSPLERHARKCTVCHHEDREDIEADFLHWHDPEEIALDFRLRSARVIYRHARATGLYQRRMHNMRDCAALVASRAENATPSGATVLKAIRACSLINEMGEWLEPPKRVIHYAVVGEPPSVPSALAGKSQSDRALPAPPDSSNEQSESNDTEVSNRHLVRLETDVTSRKETEEVLSNRH